MGRRARRREATAPAAAPPKPPSRSEARNAEVRERLEPLQEGERPRAVTVGAVVCVLLVVANLVALLAGRDIGGRSSTLVFFLVWSVILLAIAWGMWRSRYWAVLGLQALLAVAMVIFAVILFTASNLAAVGISLAVLVPAGTLFWFLVKALARIQIPTPER